MGGEGLTGKAKIILTVTDSNDNAPAFTQSSVSITYGVTYLLSGFTAQPPVV